MAIARSRDDRTTRPVLRRLAGPTIALVVVAGACSDDDGLDAAACDVYAEVQASFFGDPSTVPALLEDLTAAVPDDLRVDAEMYAKGLAASFDGDESAMSEPDFVDSSATLGDAVYADCEAEERLDVEGVDFAFEGIPAELPAGRTALRFTNGTMTGEAHEVFVARKADGVTESLDELLELPEEEAFQKLVPTAVAFSDVEGGEATTLVDLEAGDYVAFCMIPTESDGVPHAMKGMATAFSVA